MTDVLRSKWINHRDNAKGKGVQALTFEEYQKKVEEAGIDPNDIGVGIDKYQLGRYTDSGDYTPETCRFITMAQNLEEMNLNGGLARASAKKSESTKGKPIHPNSIGAGVSASILKNQVAYRFRSPSGEIFEGVNVSKFCRDMNLNSGNMKAVHCGIKDQHKGWTKA